MDGPRFTADAMLARLARWLRVLGWDTRLDPHLDDAAVVALAQAERRILLTRDRGLLRELQPAHALELRHDAPLDQLRHVVQALSLRAPAQLFTRCTVSNTLLSAPLDAVQRRDLLPPDVAALPGPARRCPGCERLYWRGSHARRMRAAIDAALPGWLPPDAPPG